MAGVRAAAKASVPGDRDRPDAGQFHRRRGAVGAVGGRRQIDPAKVHVQLRGQLLCQLHNRDGVVKQPGSLVRRVTSDSSTPPAGAPSATIPEPCNTTVRFQAGPA